ncbi:MAG: sigma-70 family RNA polymerase sigma factor [Firmicutes bacterium]|nr:sigma-70 family RNA polymerase sigma factor [Bacillota bacterium]
MNNVENGHELLVKLAKKGKMEAFESLVRLNETKIYNICLRMLGNKDDALDASQDTFIKAYKNISKFDERSKFSTWLYRIAVNTSLDMLRKNKSVKTVSMDDVKENSLGAYEKMPSPEGNPESITLENEGKAEVLSAMEKLSEEYKTALVLRDLQGLSYIEISRITDTSLGTVKSRIARGRRNLREILTGGNVMSLKGGDLN